MPHIVHLICSKFFGGPERQILGLSTFLAKEYRTSLIVFSESGKCANIQLIANQIGVPCYVLKDDFAGTLFSNNELVRFMVNLEADIICCHGYKANLIGSIASRLIHIPFIAVLRGWTGENLKIQAYETLDRVFLRHMKFIVCLTQAQVRDVKNAGISPDKIRLIPNSVAVERFPRHRCFFKTGLTNDYSAKKFLFCCSAGRLSPEKGFVDLVLVAKELRKRKLAVKFILYGEGPNRLQIERRLARESLLNSFLLPGFSTNLDQLLPAWDILVIPSYTEGLPNVLLEGLAAGVPVVATRVGGIPDLITDGVTGFLVQPGDVGAMADRIDLLAGDRQLRESFGRLGRELVEKEYTFDNQAKKYGSMFREILQRSGGKSSLKVRSLSFR